MTVADQIKILDWKIEQKEAQYDLEWEAAKICALSSENLDKYEYLTGEDPNCKQVLLNKLNLINLDWVNFLIKARKKKTKKKDFWRH